MASYARYSLRDVSFINKSVTNMQWSVDGTLLCVVTSDKNVKVLALDDNGVLQMIHSTQFQTQMTQVCWKPDAAAKQYALMSDDKPIEIWDFRAPKASLKLPSLGGNICMSWSPSGQYIAVSNKSDYLAVFDVRNGALTKKKKVSQYELNELSWSAGSDRLFCAVTADAMGGLCTFEFSNDDLRESRLLLAHCSSTYFLQSDAAKRRLALGAQDFCVTLWDACEAVCTHTLPIGADIRGVSFSGDGEHLAIISEDPSVLIVHVRSGEPVSRVVLKHKASQLSHHPSLPLLALGLEERGSGAAPLKLLAFAQ